MYHSRVISTPRSRPPRKGHREGIETVVPLREPAAQIVATMVGGLRSGMSYSDAHTIREMNARGQFVRITPAGLSESHPHGAR